MKYEISNIGRTTGVILNSIQNLINYWIPNLVRDDKPSLKLWFASKTPHISYSIFHISNTIGETIT